MDRPASARSVRQHRATSGAALLAALVLMAGGSEAAETPTAFGFYLERGYTELAVYAGSFAAAPESEARFVGKAELAAAGAAVAPEQPSDSLPAAMIDEALALRHRLATLLERGVATREPLLAARAQVNYDCWLAQFPETGQAGSADCRAQLLQTLTLLDAAVASASSAPHGALTQTPTAALIANPTDAAKAAPAAPAAESATADADGNEGPGRITASTSTDGEGALPPGTLINVEIIGLPREAAENAAAEAPVAESEATPDVAPEVPADIPAATAAPAAVAAATPQGFAQGGFGYEQTSEDRTVVGVSALARIVGPTGGLRAAPAAGLIGASVAPALEPAVPAATDIPAEPPVATSPDAVSASDTGAGSGETGAFDGIVDGIATIFSGSEAPTADAESGGAAAASTGNPTEGEPASGGTGPEAVAETAAPANQPVIDTTGAAVGGGGRPGE
jgi:hypothetical protein